MQLSVPAEPFAHYVFLLLAQGVDARALADSINVTPRWLERVLAGETTELPLLTVVGICNAMRILPDDVWSPAVAAHAFGDWPTNTFDMTDYPDEDE